MRKLIIVLLALVASVTYSATVPNAAHAQTTAAVAVNTKDGSSVFRLAFAIKKVAGDTVESTNAAVAFASCDNCKTVAISIQVVLVIGDPNVVTPTNLALAYNYECTMCETLASAYQFVLGTGGPVHFTPEGQKAISEIRKELHDLLKQDLPIEEIQARVDALMKRLAEVLKSELVASGKSGEASSRDDDEEGTKGETTTTAPTTTAEEQPPPPDDLTGTTTTEPVTTTTSP
jgi:putative peptide zinc metalloprotease protein